MLKTIIFFMSFAFTINCLAQTNLSTNGLGGSSSDATSLFSGFKTVEYGRSNFDNASNIKGTTYLFDGWKNYSKIWQNGKIFNLDSLNYNLRTDSFEFKLNNDSVFIISPENNIDKVLINYHEFKPYYNNESKSKSFYEVIWEDLDFSLLVKYNLKIKEGSMDPLTKSYITPKEYVAEENYFISKNSEEGEIYSIKLKKSEILELVDASYQDKVKKFAKEKKLKYRELSDVKQILTYYHSIKS